MGDAILDLLRRYRPPVVRFQILPQMLESSVNEVPALIGRKCTNEPYSSIFRQPDNELAPMSHTVE